MKRSLSTFSRGALAAAVLLALNPAALAVDYNWSSGTFVAGVTAPNPLAAADTLNILAGGNKFFDGAGFVFTNNGTVAWNTSNFIYMQNGAGVVNNGLWDSSADNSLHNNGGGNLSFINNGIFRKSAGAGSTTITNGTGFVNNGTLDALSGSITFNGGATFNSGSSFTGAGSVVVASGANAFNGSFGSSNLQLTGGTFTGNAVVMNGVVGLTGGTLAGGWTVAAGSTLNAGAGANKFIDGGNVVNDGTVNWNTTNFWYLANGSTFTNNGVFSASQSASVIYNGGAATAFTNSATGTLRAEATRTLNLGGTLGFVNNGGILDAAAGGSIAINGGAQLNGGTYSGAGSVTIDGNNSYSGFLNSSNIVITNGTQTGTATMLNGTLGWTGGTFGGSFTLNGGSTLTAGAGANKFVRGGSFNNNGTLAWNTTNFLYMADGAVFNNQGLFVASASTTIHDNGGTQPRFNNLAGATVRAAAGTTLSITDVLVNDGTLDAAAGATIAYSGGATFNNNTVFSGAGSNSVNGSSAFNGFMQAGNLVLTGGIYTGSNAALNGTVGWTGGSFTGGWALNAGSTLTASAGGNKFLSTGSFTNNGTMAWNTTNFLYMENGANWVNNGLFTASASTTIANNGGVQPILNNNSSGILRASGNSTLTVSNVLRNDGGRLDAESAGSSIRYSGGAVFNTGTLYTGAGTNVVAGSSAFSGAANAINGNLVLENGTHTGTAVLLSGNISWTGGSFEGGWQLAGGHTVTGNTGGNKFISGPGTVFDNLGTVVWNTTNLLYLNNARLQNAGTIDIRSDMQFVDNGGTPTFINTGLILKSGGAGTSVIQNGLGFENQGGTIDVRSGTLALPSNFSNHGVLAGTGTYSVGGTLTNALNGVLGGTVAPGSGGIGTLALTGNFAQVDGANFAIDLESMASHDLFNISGTATLAGALSLHCFAQCSYAVGDVITILDSVGNLSGGFGNNVFLNGFATGAFDVIYDTAADRVQLVVTQAVTAVPEPASYAMLLAGLAVLGCAAKRRRA